MYVRHFGLSLIMALLIVGGCGRDQDHGPTAPDPAGVDEAGADLELTAGAILAASGWELDPEVAIPERLRRFNDKSAPLFVLDHGREVLGDGIAHYWWEIPVGPSIHDRIRLHRVVKERRPCRPIRTRRNIFLMHGDAVGFAPKFLYGSVLPGVPGDPGIAVYLAREKVDVWGMDQPWKLVGLDEADFSFMADWGLDYAADRLEYAMVLARLLRTVTGCGWNRLDLLGYSSGLATGYVLLGREATRPAFLRNTAGFVAVDQVFVPVEPSDPGNCGYAEFYRGEYESGVYEDQYFGVYFIELGNLAFADPDGHSPYFDGLTNLQAALAWGVYPEEGATDHLVAGLFDDDGLPAGLQYTAVPGYVDFLRFASPYDPTRFVYEVFEVACGEIDTPFDDHLAAIEVPVLGIGAAGGAGAAGFHTLSLLGSDDVSTVLVQLHGAEEPELDFGHVDLFTASNARELVWQPILTWLQDPARDRQPEPWRVADVEYR